MKFDVYFPFTNKAGRICPGTRPNEMEWDSIKKVVMSDPHTLSLIDAVRAGNKAMKTSLPSICYVGKCQTNYRANQNMVPTQCVMIDIDHCEDPKEAWATIKLRIIKSQGEDWFKHHILIVHVTPSGKGLRIVFVAIEGKDTLLEQMRWFAETFNITEFGDFDEPTHDFARISFAVGIGDLLYESALLYMSTTELPEILKNNFDAVSAQDANTNKPDDSMSQPFTPEEIETYKNIEYRGTPVRLIIDKYVEKYGTPSSGEIHPYYNQMVKNFRCICDNNKRALLYLLPRFGHTEDECLSQINSICRVNTLSTLPKEFYFFLKDNGFYRQEMSPSQGALRDYMLNSEGNSTQRPAWLPPVFKELVATAPDDFVVPVINALLPIIGTLTSYVKAVYPYDMREHTTSFFSIIYAPPSTGKGFIERFMDMLFTDIIRRDFVQQQRENIYLRVIQRKGANDKAPDIPHTSLRIIPPKNSEAEFLQKQADNHGYHMFTYAAEMDSWAKGVKAAGGNKDDMIRIAWDNGRYGQQFKSANTFKGEVNLYWNVLITGTIQQVESYFKNVENGLVTRCSFTSIDNQEFKLAQRWRSITKKGMEVIKAFIRRCDENTYAEPCTIMPEDLIGINDDDFDKEVDWKFKFRDRKTLDCSWIMPTIDAFHKEQAQIALLDIDHARDVFRRRVGVRGFRLAMICMCLWENPTARNLEKCKQFIDWWMHKDLECMLQLWGAKYNEQADTTPKLVQRSVFDSLPEKFSRNDVYVCCVKQGIKTPVRRILFDWKKLGYCTQNDKDTFTKTKKK